MERLVTAISTPEKKKPEQERSLTSVIRRGASRAFGATDTSLGQVFDESPMPVSGRGRVRCNSFLALRSGTVRHSG